MAPGHVLPNPYRLEAYATLGWFPDLSPVVVTASKESTLGVSPVVLAFMAPGHVLPNPDRLEDFLSVFKGKK